MHDNDILNLEEAARLVHANPETLLQYIRRGELLAARVGKHIVILYVDLVSFVRTVAASQNAERQARLGREMGTSERSGAEDADRRLPPFIQLSEATSLPQPSRRKGRRRQVPPLPPEDTR